MYAKSESALSLKSVKSESTLSLKSVKSESTLSLKTFLLFYPNFCLQPLPLTSGQWAEFLPKSIMMPYWLIAEFTWDWTDIHYWTSRFILVNCLISTLLEANYVAMYIRGQQQIG